MNLCAERRVILDTQRRGVQRRKRWPGETPRGDIGKQKGPCHSGTEESDLSLGFYEYARISNCGLHNQGYSSSSEELISTVINKQLMPQPSSRGKRFATADDDDDQQTRESW